MICIVGLLTFLYPILQIVMDYKNSNIKNPDQFMIQRMMRVGPDRVNFENSMVISGLILFFIGLVVPG